MWWYSPVVSLAFARTTHPSPPHAPSLTCQAIHANLRTATQSFLFVDSSSVRRHVTSHLILATFRPFRHESRDLTQYILVWEGEPKSRGSNGRKFHGPAPIVQYGSTAWTSTFLNHQPHLKNLGGLSTLGGILGYPCPTVEPPRL